MCLWWCCARRLCGDYSVYRRGLHSVGCYISVQCLSVAQAWLVKSFDTFVLVTVGAAAILLGAWLLLSPGFFLSLLMLVLGVLLLAMGFYQLVVLLAVQRSLHLSFYMYIVPLLLLAMGVLVVVNPFEAAAIPSLWWVWVRYSRAFRTL